ncbi:MAG TPA: hypothetical protein DCS93_18455 [Microscillaceae bacterium]|nr:hypothetical protein [Microscillaceae bacterium]
MPTTNHQAKLKEAYQKLSPRIREIVDQGRFTGSFKPDEIIDILLELRDYGEKVKPKKNELKIDIKRSGEDRTRRILVVVIIAVTMLGLISLIFDGVGWYILMMILVGALGALVWFVIKWLRSFAGKLPHIQWQSLSFALHLVALLKDEIRPGQPLDITLDLGTPIQRRYYVKTHKNYLFLGHRLVIRGFWLLVLASLAWVSFAILSNNSTIPSVMIAFLFPLIPVILMVYLIVLAIAAAALGKTNKIKTRLYRSPQLLVKATLADGTLFQTEVASLLALRRVHKKKFKLKNFQVTKVKRKHKVKTLTTLKLAFPLKKYRMTEGSFKENFDRNWRIRNRKVDKVKLKSGDKRKTVVYQDAQTGQGEGYQNIAYPSPNFQRFLELVTRSGFQALERSIGQKTPVDKAKNRDESKAQAGDDLTKIEGIIKPIQERLYQLDIATYRQLADLDRGGFEDLAQELGVAAWQLEEWQEAAWKIDNESLQSPGNQSDNLTKIKGIGQSTADKLNAWGVFSYQQMANLSKDDFEDILQRINVSLNKAEDWQAQARTLVNKQANQQ